MIKILLTIFLLYLVSPTWATTEHSPNCNEAVKKIVHLLTSASVTFSGQQKEYFHWQLSLADHLAFLLGRTNNRAIILKIKPILRANPKNYFTMENSYAKLQAQIYQTAATWATGHLRRPAETPSFNENAIYAIVPSFQQIYPRPVLLLQVDPSAKLATAMWILKIDHKNNTIVDIIPMQMINPYP